MSEAPGYRTGQRCFFGGEQVLDGEYLGGEKSIESVKAEGAAAAQEVRDMRGLKAGLPSEESAIHTTAIDAAEEFHA